MSVAETNLLISLIVEFKKQIVSNFKFQMVLQDVKQMLKYLK